jgi:CubicO group peptidase (beta-lactamase class C family)
MAQATASVELAGVHDVAINEAAIAAHVIAPANVVGVKSSRGLQDGVIPANHVGEILPLDHFDVAGFGTALHAALKNDVAGYTMRLRQNGTTIYTLEWNWAKTPTDGGEGWTPDVRMHIASVSKLVTGIAMTKLLNDKGISYDTPIVSHLPTYWVKGPGVGKITFRQLMTQTSGLNFGVNTSASDYESMKAAVAAGVPDNGQYWYQNMNFGLCRILLATVNGNVSPGAMFTILGIPATNDQIWDSVTINAYVQYVQAHVFGPAGVSGPTLDHPAADALAYNFPVSGGGWNSGDLTSVIGGAGWHMSIDDLLSIMGTFRRSGTIMSAAQAQTALDDGFGIDVRQSTALGTLYNKNGLWEDGAGHVEQSLAYFLPGNMELVVLANSPIGATGKFFRDVVTNIYLANIKPSVVLHAAAAKVV